MPKAYIASLNKVKVEAVKKVLTEYEVIAKKGDSKVSNQPKSESETIQGAYNRCLSLPKDGLRIGLEAGVSMIDGIMFLINYGVMIDEQDNIYYAGGARIPLPEYVKERLLNTDLELAEVMEEYTKIKDIRSKNGAMGVFTNNRVERIDLFVHIMNLLYGQYEFRKEQK